jgi:DNA repair protein RadA/Sms
LRLKEAGKLGFERAILPAGAKGEGMRVSGFRTLAQFVDQLLGR